MPSLLKATQAAPVSRINVRVTCTNGNTWSTGFNGSIEEARAYFLGQSFTREDYDGRELFDVVAAVKLLD